MDHDAAFAAALPVFFRYGFRKTTMDDLSQAVGVSRQGLYNHFPSKKLFFEAMVSALGTKGLAEFVAALDNQGVPDELAARILEAFDRWYGQHLDALRSSPHAAEISRQLCEAAGDKRLQDNALIAALEEALPRAQSWETATTIYAAAKGLAKMSESRAEFLERMSDMLAVVLRP